MRSGKQFTRDYGCKETLLKIHLGISDINSLISRPVTARGSCTGLGAVGPNKV